jgi:hypothetical protein
LYIVNLGGGGDVVVAIASADGRDDPATPRMFFSASGAATIAADDA